MSYNLTIYLASHRVSEPCHGMDIRLIANSFVHTTHNTIVFFGKFILLATTVIRADFHLLLARRPCGQYAINFFYNKELSTPYHIFTLKLFFVSIK